MRIAAGDVSMRATLTDFEETSCYYHLLFLCMLYLVRRLRTIHNINIHQIQINEVATSMFKLISESNIYVTAVHHSINCEKFIL